MVSLGQTFDATTVEPATGGGSRPVVPPGDYLVHMINSDYKPTSKNDGQRLILTYAILEGEYKDYELEDGLNIENPSQQTMEIARRSLSAICHATGVMTLSNTDQLHYKPLVVSVSVVPPSGTNPKTGQPYPAKNEIKKYSSSNGAAPRTQTTQPQQQAQVANAPVKRPWAR